ncbi:MAG: nitrous oxide reductase accessory protein NosL [Halobacteriaceae archaeon]
MCDASRAAGGGHAGDDAAVTRRALLGGGAAVAVAAVAGCAGRPGGDGDGPDPVTLTTADACDVCGMVIPNHPGPSAEIFYADHGPTGHDGPAHFDSTWEAFEYDFEKQDAGWTREAFYVTDYSAVDYEVFTEGGDSLLSTHPEAGAFVDAAAVTFVVGSEVRGAMGRDLVGFSAADDARAFREEYGGETATLDEVTPMTVAQLGQG